MPILALVYLGFIAIGLPEALLGASWPAMGQGVHAPLTWVAWIAVCIAAGSLAASLLSEPVLRKYGMARVMNTAVILTVIALFGFAFSTQFVCLLVFAIPYGVGAGMLTVALDAFVAVRYHSTHINWMHAATAAGALAGHTILGFVIAQTSSWQIAYGTVGAVQLVAALILIAYSKRWQFMPEHIEHIAYAQKDWRADMRHAHHTFKILRWKGVITILVICFAFTAVEQTTMLWASSYMVHADHMSIHTAGIFANLFFVGLTVGAVIAGIAASHTSDSTRLLIGVMVIVIALIIMLIPMGSWRSVTVPVLLGLGCGPIHPALVHMTPRLWPAQAVTTIIGLETAAISLATMIVPASFAIVEAPTSMHMLPWYLSAFAAILVVSSVLLLRRARLQKRAE